MTNDELFQNYPGATTAERGERKKEIKNRMWRNFESSNSLSVLRPKKEFAIPGGARAAILIGVRCTPSTYVLVPYVCVCVCLGGVGVCVCMWNLGMYYVLRITVTVNTSENTRTWWNNLALWGWSLPVQPPLGLTDTRPTLGPTARYTTAPTQQETSPILHDIEISVDHVKIILSSIDSAERLGAGLSLTQLTRFKCIKTIVKRQLCYHKLCEIHRLFVSFTSTNPS